MLYDEEFIDQLPLLVQFENPWVVGICRIDKNAELRRLIEKWYVALLEDIKPKFYERLRSQKDEDIIPAIYELMMYRFCIEERWAVEYEPILNSGDTPDLIVTLPDGYKFVLEAATLFDSQELTRSNKKKHELTHRISQIETEYILELHYFSHPTPSARPRVALDRITSWLKELPGGDDQEVHTCSFGAKGTGYHVEVKARKGLPRPSQGCVFSVMDPGGIVPDYSDRLKGILDKKRRKYSSKKTNLPLVVMMGNAIGLLRGDANAIDRALFGQHQITFAPDVSSQPTAHRDRSGYFTPRNASDGSWIGKNTGVSAVLFAAIGDSGSFQMQVFHNPIPHIAIDENIFSKMPQLQVFEKSNHVLTMRWVITNPEFFRIHFS